MKKIILFLILIGISVAFIFWFYQNREFSKEILRIEILGPEKVKLGEEIEYKVKYKNTGNFILENLFLTFEMPSFSFTLDGKPRLTQTLPDIYPGEEKIFSLKARLLGKEGEFKTAKARISYTPENLNVKYEVENTFTTKIEEIPITLNFNLPLKIESGKSFSISINYFSNLEYPLENLSLKFFPPPNFEIESCDPSSLDGFEWKIEKLEKTQGGKINIKGKMSGDPEQVYELRAQLGVWIDGNFVVLKETNKEISLSQPLILISQVVNGSNEYVASPGELLHYQILFKNIGLTPFEDLFLIVRINGLALDFSSLKVKDGYFQPESNIIMWDNKKNIFLRYLPPGEEGKVEFYVKLKDYWEGLGKNEENNLIVTEVNIAQTTQKFFVKINGGLIISQQAFYKSSDFENTGSIPPKVKETTTYTIRWEIKNYFNDIKNVKVRATLGPNVILTGKILPSYQFSNFSFDSETREIIWLVGDVPAGTGVKGDPLSLSFQIAFTPSLEQKGSLALLISKVEIQGENQFTKTIINSFDSPIDTSLPDDFLNSGGGIVQ